MKRLLLIPALSIPLLFSACDTLIVDERPVHRRTAYVERDVHVHRDYDRRDRRDYDRSDYDRRYDRSDRHESYRSVRYDRDRDDDRRSTTVVVKPSSTHRPAAVVRYQTDSRGRYYIKDGRRIYSDAGSPR